MATHLPVLGGHPEGIGATTRTDRWWAGPSLTFALLSGFVVYTTWAAFQGVHYFADPYLSPFYSPALFVKTGVAGAPEIGGFHGWFGEWPSWWPEF